MNELIFHPINYIQQAFPRINFAADISQVNNCHVLSSLRQNHPKGIYQNRTFKNAMLS